MAYFLNVLLVFLLLTASSFAETHTNNPVERRYTSSGSFRFGSGIYPTTVDLSREFPTREEDQEGGSCHVYASTGLFGHACFRQTGQWMDLDETYLMLRHLRQQFIIESRKPATLQNQLVEAFRLLIFQLNSNGIISPFDGVKADSVTSTLKRITGGSCRIEKPYFKTQNLNFWYNFSEEFERDYKNTEGKDYSAIVQFYAQMVQRIDAVLLAIDAVDHRDGYGPVIRDQDPLLKECLNKKWSITSNDWNEETAYSLLSKRIPFACAGNWDVNTKTINHYRDKPSNHIAIITGYDRTASGTLWQVRNSQNNLVSQTNWDLRACEKMVVLGVLPN